jgi:hypothetical protein
MNIQYPTPQTDATMLGHLDFVLFLDKHKIDAQTAWKKVFSYEKDNENKNLGIVSPAAVQKWLEKDLPPFPFEDISEEGTKTKGADAKKRAKAKAAPKRKNSANSGVSAFPSIVLQNMCKRQASVFVPTPDVECKNDIRNPILSNVPTGRLTQHDFVNFFCKCYFRVAKSTSLTKEHELGEDLETVATVAVGEVVTLLGKNILIN